MTLTHPSSGHSSFTIMNGNQLSVMRILTVSSIIYVTISIHRKIMYIYIYIHVDSMCIHIYIYISHKIWIVMLPTIVVAQTNYGPRHGEPDRSAICSRLALNQGREPGGVVGIRLDIYIYICVLK